MDELTFYKFDGAGNDFVLLDVRQNACELSERLVAHICHRRLGVGADGLMALGVCDDGSAQFVMRYFNSDGREATMCGNGGRCIALFAHMLGMPANLDFIGPDGLHHADVLLWDPESGMGLVRLGMREVRCSEVRRVLDGWFLDTGSPHFVQRVSDLDHFDVVAEGRRIRNMSHLFPLGTNVDFIEDAPDGSLRVRTYERGAEDETWACGTGVTACAIVTGNGCVSTRGGHFKVSFVSTGDAYTDVQLTGPVSYNFKGVISLSAYNALPL